jgi:hypothetical protein
MTELTVWDLVKKYYQDTFNVPPRYLDLAACIDILRLCVEGYGNLTISRRLKLPVDYIEDVLYDFLNFYGWDADLDISPIAIYNLSANDFEYYRQRFLMLSPFYYNDRLIKKSFKVCQRYKELLKELEDLYDKVS